MPTQPVYTTAIALNSTAARTFSGLPAEIMAGTSFKLEVAVTTPDGPADLTGLTATLSARPANTNPALIPNQVLHVDSAPVANVFKFTVTDSELPVDWVPYTQIALWITVTDGSDVTWTREATIRLVDPERVGAASATAYALVSEETGDFDVAAKHSGRVVFFNGGEINFTRQRIGTTIVFINTESTDSLPFTFDSVTAFSANATNRVKARGSLSVTYRSLGEIYISP